MILISLLLLCQDPAAKKPEPVKNTENKTSVPAAEAPPTAAEIQAAVASGEGTKAVNAFFEAMQNKDCARILSSTSGPIHTLVEVIADGDGKWESDEGNFPSIGAEVAGTDFIRVPVQDGDYFYMVRRSKGIWLVCDLFFKTGEVRQDWKKDTFNSFEKMLKNCGSKLQIQANKDGGRLYPERLELPIITGSVPNVQCSIIVEYACIFVVDYAGALPINGKEKKVLACLTKPYYGKRAVLWSDGSTEMLDEAAFKKLGFVANQYKAPPLDPVLAKTVADLIPQLGGNAKERRETRKKLTALGMPAVKILKTHTGNADPEIAEAVKEIIAAILPKPEEKTFVSSPDSTPDCGL
jgi:hypothetical protein